MYFYAGASGVSFMDAAKLGDDLSIDGETAYAAWKKGTEIRAENDKARFKPEASLANPTLAKAVSDSKNNAPGKQGIPQSANQNDSGEKKWMPSTKEIEKSFNIGNIRDYINVQKNVRSTLESEGFFQKGAVVNKESGATIEVNWAGIKETLGSGNNFQYLSVPKKQKKLAVLRNLHSLIENARVTDDNSKNYHKENSSVQYMYLEAETKIDGEPAIVKIDIRKAPQKNQFWVHQIYTKEAASVPAGTQYSSKTGFLEPETASENNISQKSSSVKKAYIEAARAYRTEENAKEFDEAYNIGLAGETLDGFAPDADITSMTKAYMAGVNDRAAFRERAAQRTTFNATRKGLSSDDLTETLIKRYSAKTREVLQNLGEALGVQIKLVTNSGIEGHEMDSYYDSKSGVIAINVNEVHRNPKIKTKTKDGSLAGDDLIRFVAAHEGIHRVRETSPKAYAQMEKIALSKSKVTVSEYMKKHGVSEALAKEEITADYFGDLLTNKAEIKALMNKNRGLFDIIREVLEKIGNALRKAGIDFAEIAEARRLFREALKEADSSVWGEDARGGGEVNFSISEIIAEDGTNYGMGVYLDSNLLTGLTEKERIQMVKEFVKELGGNEFIAYDKNKSAIKIRIAEHSKRFKNKSGNSIRVNKDLVSYLNNKVKQEAIVLIDELIANSDYEYSSKAKYSHGWVDDGGKNPWDYWKVFIQEKNKTVWEATLNVANTANGEKILYDIYPIKMVEQSVTSDTSTTNDNISQKSDGVNTYSMQDSKKDADKLLSRSEDGTKYFPKGEEPRRDIDVPSEIDRKKVMRGARTAAEAPGVSDEIAEDVVTEIENGRFFYTPSVNSVLMANAESRVSENYDEAMTDWLKVVGGGRVMPKLNPRVMCTWIIFMDKIKYTP